MGHILSLVVFAFVVAPAFSKCSANFTFPESAAIMSGVMLESFWKSQRITPGRTH
ncbi:MAG: hypothetical protein HC767_09000 [Akkermansiaceae bacterium]|nr:hypothetical protein [Akkermansiaceae bacterium]